MEGSTCAVAVARGAVGPSSPMYHETVFAGVPATSVVAVSKGGPATRCGGCVASVLKKSFPAATAEAAVSEVAASLPSEVVSAACKLAAVAAGVTPMANWSVPGVAELVAVSVRLVLVPSGSVKLYDTASPSLGTPVKSTDVVGGAPPTGVNVALLSVDDA